MNRIVLLGGCLLLGLGPALASAQSTDTDPTHRAQQDAAQAASERSKAQSLAKDAEHHADAAVSAAATSREDEIARTSHERITRLSAAEKRREHLIALAAERHRREVAERAAAEKHGLNHQS
jgi:hypothetical protein